MIGVGLSLDCQTMIPKPESERREKTRYRKLLGNWEGRKLLGNWEGKQP